MFGVFGIGPIELVLLALMVGGPVLVVAGILYFLMRDKPPKE